MRIGLINGQGQSLFSSDANEQSPSQPAISFSGNTTTGMYLVSANTIGFSTGSSLKLTIATNGLLTVSGGAGVYAGIVAAENDIPNKGYVDTAVSGGIGALSLDSLTDVTITSAAEFEILMVDGSGEWVDTTPANARTGLGLVSGGAGDIWIEKAGDSMNSTKNIVFSNGGNIIGLTATPTNSTEAASKAYVDAVVSGLGWTAAIADPDLNGIAADTPAGAVLGSGYIAYKDGTGLDTPTGDWLADISGVVEYDYVYKKTDGDWIIVGNIAAASGVVEVRFGVAFEHGTADISLTAININDQDLIEYIGGSSGDPKLAASWKLPQGHAGTHTFPAISTTSPDSIKITGDQTLSFFTGNRITLTGANAGEYIIDTVTFNTPNTDVVITTATLTTSAVAFTVESEIFGGTTTMVNATNSQHNGHSYSYNETSNVWNEVSGPGSIGAGDGLSYSGSTLNVNFGAGIANLPTDEVGVDLYVSASSALILTNDGSTRGTATGDQLALLLDSGNTLSQGTSGLKITADGVTETEIASTALGDGLTGGSTTVLSVSLASSPGLAFNSGDLFFDINTLGIGGTVVLTDRVAVEQTTGTASVANTFTDIVQDLGIPHGLENEGVGFIVSDGVGAANAYTTVAITQSAVIKREGITVTNGTGTANVVIGLGIDALNAAPSNLVGGDLIVVNDGSNNVQMTGTQLAAGLSTMLTLDNTRIVDAGGTTWIDTDAPANTITSSVKADATHAVGSPLTLSAASTAITSSAGLAATNDGAPLNITAGDGLTSGNGGELSIVSGATAGGTGGNINITSGASTASSGYAGDIYMTGGASSHATGGQGGEIKIIGGTSVGSQGGFINIIGGAGETGGGVNVKGGNGTGGTGGNALIYGGAGSSGYDGGDVLLTSGAGGAGANAGSVLIKSGVAGTTSGDAGVIRLQTRLGDGGANGYIEISAETGAFTPTLRFNENTSVGSNYVGLKAPASVGSDITYTLPVSPTNTYVLQTDGSGILSWVNPVSAGATNSFGVITVDAGDTTVSADIATDSVALVGATNGGITTTGNNSSKIITVALDISDLGTGGETLVVGDSIGVYDGTATLNYTFTNMVQDLKIPNSIGGAAGYVVSDGNNNYITRVFASEGTTGNKAGISVASGDGTAATTIGLDIAGMTETSAALTGTDLIAVYNGAENIPMTGADLASGLNTLLSLDATRIHDSADTTFVDTDAPAKTIATGVGIGSNNVAGTPLTMSADGGTLVTSSAGIASANAGAPISLTAGDSGGSTSDGGSITLTAGDSDATTGAVIAVNGGTAADIGGSATITGGAGAGNLAGGAVSMTGGAGNGTATGGTASLIGGAGGATGFGGAAIVTGGSNSDATDQAGDVTITGGANADVAGDGGDVTITGGAGGATTGVGGSIIMTPGGGNADGTLNLTGSGSSTEMRFYDADASNYIGLRSPDAVTTDSSYQLPEYPATSGYLMASTDAGVMSWVAPGSIGGNSYGVIQGDGATSATATALSDTISIVGATNGGIVTAASDGPDTLTIAMDITDLTAASIATADELAFNDSGVGTRKITVDNFIKTLDIVTTSSGSIGLLTQMANDTYGVSTLTAGGAGLQGIVITDGDGVGTAPAQADPVIGLDIAGLTTEAGTPSGSDSVAMFDGVNNVEATLEQINGAMRLEDLADVVADTTTPDAVGKMLVSDGVDSYDAKTIIVKQSFTGTSIAVTHSIGQFVMVQVYDNQTPPQLIIPASVALTSTTVCTVGFNTSTSGTIVVMGVPGVS